MFDLSVGGLLKWFVALSVLIITSVWFLNTVIIESKRDLHTISLNAQSNADPVRKEHETAVYRNYLVPPSFPLTTGLNLSIGYRLRNGNFGDLWSAIIANGSATSLDFDSESKSLADINGIAKKLVEKIELIGAKKIGISLSTDSFTGFSVSIGGLMLSLKNVMPLFLHTVPRTEMDIDVLLISNWKSVQFLNGSEKWYKWVVVCEESAEVEKQESFINIISLKQFLGGKVEPDNEFLYDPKDSSDDAKVIMQISNPAGGLTSFTQMSLVSSVSSYIKSFPIGHTLSTKDQLTICPSSQWNHSICIQAWPKIFAVLLHGGSVSFRNNVKSLIDLPKETTLLMIPHDYPILKHLLNHSKGIRSSLSIALFSEGVYNKMGQISRNIDELRCVYIFNELKNVSIVTDFSAKIPKLTKMQIQRYTSAQVTHLRSLLGSRVIMELYSPFSIFGPLCYTNYYDYRVFPSELDKLVTCYGSFSTSLEGKLVETEENPELEAEKRQGMLVVRGFTIGKPVEEDRLANAMKLSEKFDGGEGWMPLLGVFGLFGNDGCFYEYK